jgi:predicted nucleic acid-binding Zn ribbon protein
MAAKPLATCPENLCAQKRWGKGKVKKMISAGAGLIFKGSGFYITDYRSEKYKEAAKKDTGTPSKDTGTPSKDTGTPSTPGGDSKATKPASGGDGKPAPKAESKPTKPPKATS